MRYLLFSICIATGCFANAQQKIAYTGSVEGGLLMGSKPVNSFVFVTQGVAYKQYTFGIGSGFDFYPFRSVPLFVDVKRKFTGKKVQPFIQAAAGINFTSANSSDAKYIYQYADGKFRHGFFTKTGGGLILRAQKKLKVSLSAGYSYKTTTYAYKPFTGDPWVWQIQPIKDKYHYNRWYIGAGIMW